MALDDSDQLDQIDRDLDELTAFMATVAGVCTVAGDGPALRVRLERHHERLAAHQQAVLAARAKRLAEAAR